MSKTTKGDIKRAKRSAGIQKKGKARVKKKGFIAGLLPSTAQNAVNTLNERDMQ